MKATLKQPKILFFTAGPVPTAKEKLEALDLGNPVQWRNGSVCGDEDYEPCDGYAGAAPKIYKEKKVKTAKTAVADYKKKLEAAMKGEEKAPSQQDVDDEGEGDEKSDDKGGMKDAGTWGANANKA